MRLVSGCDEAAATWAARRLGIESFGPSSAYAIFDEAGEMAAAIVYHNFHPRYRSVEMSIATVTPRWATRRIVCRTLGFAFEHLGCVRVTAVTPRKSASPRRLLEKLGFKREGLIRRGYLNDDGVLYGMLRKEWLRGKWGPIDGQGDAQRARSDGDGAGADSLERADGRL